MTIHKCDVCGKEMCSWLNLPIFQMIICIYHYLNISNILRFRTTHEVCRECWENITLQFGKKT